MYDKILVPLDGSPTSERGFEEAVALARVMKSKLVLMHVIDTAPVAVDMVGPVTWQDVSDGLRKHGQGLLDRAAKTAAEHGVASESRLTDGRAERAGRPSPAP
jgi:nucleotide-binding universal stress UspA family protein